MGVSLNPQRMPVHKRCKNFFHLEAQKPRKIVYPLQKCNFFMSLPSEVGIKFSSTRHMGEVKLPKRSLLFFLLFEKVSFHLPVVNGYKLSLLLLLLSLVYNTFFTLFFYTTVVFVPQVRCCF